MSEVVLECKNLTKKVNKKEIVKDISFKLNKGDILGFIGPNGAGKTTIIKMILGLYNIDYGTVIINNYNLRKNHVQAIKEVGAIIENPDMYMYMSGLDNLKISAKIYNINKEKVEETIKLVGLESRINDKVSKYSLGMRQRLGIAQSIIHDPKIIILDEPTNGLDPEGIKELKQLLIKLSKKGMAIIVSSHILSELESFCNKICIINKGKLINYFTKEELLKLSHNQNYILKLDNTNLNEYLDNYKIIDENHIKISIDKTLNNTLKKLIENNITIYEIKKEVLSLEDIFLKQVGGSTID